MSGQRLTVPEPDIELYEQGFEAASDLDRAPDGKKLSDLVERIEEPMVIAVDAPWGAGKSVFLKCWVGAHIKDNEGKATTVYFDAYQDDYLDDPLVSLVRTISKRIEDLTPADNAEDNEKTQIKKLKESVWKASVYAPALGRAALRLGVAAGTAGLIRNIDDVAESVLDEAAKQGAKELDNAIGKFWQAEEARVDAMESFRTYLQELSSDQKLVIVVDELDRCRPDYALNLLEVIKHFFNVPNLHFVLGVNLTELENSVRARYGAGVNASKYLQKFYNVRMPLSLKAPVGSEIGSLYAYFEDQSTRLGFDNTHYRNVLGVYFKAFSNIPDFSLRDANAILTAAMLTPSPTHDEGDIPEYLTAGLIALRVLNKELYTTLRERLFEGSKTFERIQAQFGLLDRPSKLENPDISKITFIWRWALAGTDLISSGEDKLKARGVKGDIPSHGRTHLRELIRERVDLFEYEGEG